MKGLKDTLAELAGLRKRFETIVAPLQGPANGAGVPNEASRLVDMRGFGSNPGNLRMRAHVPAKLPTSPALVVALHGCTQSASAYDHGSGWSALADAYGFIALLPEQQSANNPNLCFNWFLASDTQRGNGEAHSIHQMIEHLVAERGIDRSRIFVVGLSAGGAMAAAMLASYPDVFAGGGIVAGLPHGAASNVQSAFQAMSGSRSHTPQEWGDLVRSSSSHRGPWPKVSIWHGRADTVVNPANLEHSISQWTSVHGVDTQPSEQRLPGYSRRVWTQGDRPVVEAISIDGMGHGVPLGLSAAGERWGNVSPFHFDVGVSSSRRILQFWDLAEGVARVPEGVLVGETLRPQDGMPPPRQSGADAPSRPSDVIAAALTAAGLLKSGDAPAAKDPRGIIAATLRSVGLLKG